MKRYRVRQTENKPRLFYIIDMDTYDIVPLPSKYLKNKIEINRSPNTVGRDAFSICCYMNYIDEKALELVDVCKLSFEEQNKHFVQFLYWLLEGNHTEESGKEQIRKGTCNAYLKDVFRFFLYASNNGYLEPLKVLEYNLIARPNEVGVKRTIRFKSFTGYFKAEERDVKAAKENEIIEILQACTNCRDQLLILLLAETGFRIGEILGIDYTRDINYQNHTISVYFRPDNENEARAKNAEQRRAKLSKDTFDFLMHYLSQYRKELQHQNFLFISIQGNTIGKPMKVGSVYDMLRRMQKKTGIKLTPHMLRRYYARARWDAGWVLELISHGLGHKHLDTTTKYLGVVDDKLIEASNEFYRKHSDTYGIRDLL